MKRQYAVKVIVGPPDAMWSLSEGHGRPVHPMCVAITAEIVPGLTVPK